MPCQWIRCPGLGMDWIIGGQSGVLSGEPATDQNKMRYFQHDASRPSGWCCLSLHHTVEDPEPTSDDLRSS